jgi:hypothetical protein
MAAIARIPVLPEAIPVRVLSARLRQSRFARRPTALDPLLTFEIAYEWAGGARKRSSADGVVRHNRFLAEDAIYTNKAQALSLRHAL